MTSRRDTYLRRVYGISESDYLDLLERQGGGCAICGKTVEQEGRWLAVEHCHTGEHKGSIRGICCGYCNLRLIQRHNDPTLLRKLADYIDLPHTGWFVPKKKPRTKKRKK